MIFKEYMNRAMSDEMSEAQKRKKKKKKKEIVIPKVELNKVVGDWKVTISKSGMFEITNKITGDSIWVNTDYDGWKISMPGVTIEDEDYIKVLKKWNTGYKKLIKSRGGKLLKEV